MAQINTNLQKALPWILIIGGIIGYICSFIIMFDKIKILQNPNYTPICNLNPVLSCGTVMQSKQANVFGFPNPFIGLGAFPVMAVIGGAMLAGAKFKKWFWQAFGAGMALGLLFAYWLLFESIYRIHALCPFCLAIDVVMITVAWYLKLYLIDNKLLPLPKFYQKIYPWIRKHHLDILIAWFIILIALILKHFWYYYKDHLF